MAFEIVLHFALNDIRLRQLYFDAWHISRVTLSVVYAYLVCRSRAKTVGQIEMRMCAYFCGPKGPCVRWGSDHGQIQPIMLEGAKHPISGQRRGSAGGVIGEGQPAPSQPARGLG